MIAPICHCSILSGEKYVFWEIKSSNMVSKVIIVTGASRGIGLAVAKYLLNASHKVVLVSRTAKELEAVKAQYPSQVQFLAADLTNMDVGKKMLEGENAGKNCKGNHAEPTYIGGSQDYGAGSPVIRPAGRHRHQPRRALAHETTGKLDSGRMEEDIRCQLLQRTCPGESE